MLQFHNTNHLLSSYWQEVRLNLHVSVTLRRCNKANLRFCYFGLYKLNWLDSNTSLERRSDTILVWELLFKKFLTFNWYYPIYFTLWHQLTHSVINIQSSFHILSWENKMETVHKAYFLLMTHLLWSQAVITLFVSFILCHLTSAKRL